MLHPGRHLLLNGGVRGRYVAARLTAGLFGIVGVRHDLAEGTYSVSVCRTLSVQEVALL